MNLETGIQTAILNLLSLYENMGKVYALRHNSFSGKIIGRSGHMGFMKQSKKGVPDILCCIGGRFVGFEVKTDTGKQSPDQKTAQTAIEKCGGLYYLVRSVNEVENIVKLLLFNNSKSN